MCFREIGTSGLWASNFIRTLDFYRASEESEFIVSERDAHLAFEYFSGFVPPGATFKIILDDLRDLSASAVGKELSGSNRVHELCFIGLMSYFEAFCKDHFASLINIEPGLIGNLQLAGQDVAVDANRVLLFGAEVGKKMGFIVAEKYDFGTAQKTNALFTALLKLTPFGKNDAKLYTQLLAERNLLVHHGGTYTLSYLEQAGLSKDDVKVNAFVYSNTKKKDDVRAAIDFIGNIAKKMITSSHAALSQYLVDNAIHYTDERRKSVEYVLWWE